MNLVDTAKQLVATGTLVGKARATHAEVTELETWLGFAMPASYRQLVTECGEIDCGDQDGGWSHDYIRILGPVAARRMTEQIRNSYASDPKARHSKTAQSMCFFMQWQLHNETFGVAADGLVRTLHHYRHGTVLRKLAPLDIWWATKFGELLAAQTDDAASAGSAAVDVAQLKFIELSEDNIATVQLAHMPNLESLELRTRALDFIDALPALPRLHTIDAYFHRTLPDALFRQPALRHLKSLGYPNIDATLAWFASEAIAPERRHVFMRIYHNEVAWARQHASVEELLLALDAPSSTLANHAMGMLNTRLPEPRLEKKAVIAIIGSTAESHATLAQRAEQIGFVVQKKISTDTTHVLVGIGPKKKWQAAQQQGLTLLVEAQLQAVLTAQAPGHLAQLSSTDADAANNLIELLLSSDRANHALAVAMMAQGGVPAAAREASFVLTQKPNADKKLRVDVEKLLKRQWPTIQVAANEVLAKTNLFASGAEKLADRLRLLEERSGGILDGRRLAHVLARQGKARAVILYSLETKDVSFAREIIDLARAQIDDDWFGLVGQRLDTALRACPTALEKLPWLTNLAIAFNQLRELPPEVCVASVEQLNARGNLFKTLPNELARCKALTTLEISDNAFTSLPAVLAKLPALRELAIGQSERRPRLTSLQGIAACSRLTHLSLQGQPCALPAELAQLPLVKLDLTNTALPEVPTVLAAIATLKELEVSRATVEDKAQWKDLLATLKKRGVNVST